MATNLEKLAQEYGQEGYIGLAFKIKRIATVSKRIETRKILISMLRSNLPENRPFINR